jgi:hypothetical protein
MGAQFVKMTVEFSDASQLDKWLSTRIDPATVDTHGIDATEDEGEGTADWAYLFEQAGNDGLIDEDLVAPGKIVELLDRLKAADAHWSWQKKGARCEVEARDIEDPQLLQTRCALAGFLQANALQAKGEWVLLMADCGHIQDDLWCEHLNMDKGDIRALEASMMSEAIDRLMEKYLG